MRPTNARRLAMIAVKSVHTLIWALVEGAVGYLLIAGVAKRSDRRAAAAGVVVAAESIVYLANGARCPLTGLAESLGAESGEVTDLFLPRWIARNLPVLHVPLIALVLVLHRKALARGFRSGAAGGPHPEGDFNVVSHHGSGASQEGSSSATAASRKTGSSGE